MDMLIKTLSDYARNFAFNSMLEQRAGALTSGNSAHSFPSLSPSAA